MTNKIAAKTRKSRCSKIVDKFYQTGRSRNIAPCHQAETANRSLLRNFLQHRKPGVLLLRHEGENLFGRHGARIAADVAQPLLEVRIADHFGEVRADLADDR